MGMLNIKPASSAARVSTSPDWDAINYREMQDNSDAIRETASRKVSPVVSDYLSLCAYVLARRNVRLSRCIGHQIEWPCEAGQ